MNAFSQSKLRLVKAIHTLIWAVLASIVLYVLYSGVTSNISLYSWLGVVTVLIEGVVLIIFGGSCPLTKVARRYSSSMRDNFDIYLPVWLARHNKLFFGTLFVIGLALMLINYFRSGLVC